MERSTGAGDEDAGRHGGDVAVEGVRLGVKRIARQLGCSYHTVKADLLLRISSRTS